MNIRSVLLELLLPIKSLDYLYNKITEILKYLLALQIFLSMNM